MNYPRLLVLSEGIPETAYAGSLLLYRLLKTYPPDRLLIIGPAPQERSQKLTCRYETLEVPWRRWEKTRLSRLVRSLRLFSMLPRPTVRQVHDRLHGFRPQIVLSVMQVESYFGLAARFAASESLPLVLIVHDLPEKFEAVFPLFCTAQRRHNARIYKSAARRLCVSPEMRDHLNQVYCASGEVLYPNRSEELTLRAPEQNLSLKVPGVLTVGYAGTIGYGYGLQLQRMVPAFERSGSRLRVYSAGRLESSASCVENVGYAPLAEQTWARVKEECDAVILPYTWGPGHRALYETHFPSKLSEYLSLGMPVLIVGPPWATGVRWGLRHPGGCMVVTEDSQSASSSAFAELRGNAQLRASLAAGAVWAGAEDFDPVRIREAFLSVVDEASALER